MKLRVLKKSVYVSSALTKGKWNSSSINRTKDILQYWDDDKGWLDIPVEKETINVYEHDTVIENW